MSRHFFQQLFYFILLVLLQDFVIDRLPLGTYVNPEIYLLFILMLPFNSSTISTMFWAFAMGLSIDILSMGVLGLHTSALLVLALVRRHLLKLVSSKEQMESNAYPCSRLIGFQPYLTYVAISVLLHTTILLSLDNFNFNNIEHLLLRILSSSLVTTIFIVAMQYAFTGKQKTRNA